MWQRLKGNVWVKLARIIDRGFMPRVPPPSTTSSVNQSITRVIAATGAITYRPHASTSVSTSYSASWVADRPNSLRSMHAAIFSNALSGGPPGTERDDERAGRCVGGLDAPPGTRRLVDSTAAEVRYLNGRTPALSRIPPTIAPILARTRTRRCHRAVALVRSHRLSHVV